MDDKRIHILRDMPINKAIQKLSLPAIIGFMVMGLYNLVDTIFVARWNYQGAAAVQVLFPIMMMASSIGLGFGVGSGSYISRLLGKNDKKRANEVLSTSLITATIVAVIYVTCCILFLKPIVMKFGAEADIIPLSLQYGFYITLASIFVIPSMVLNNSLRAEGSAKFSMMSMIIGTVLNLILDPIFIFTLDFGVEGAAISTMISQGVAAVILLFYYINKKTVIEFRFLNFRFDIDIYKEVLKIGLPTFFRQILFSISMGILNNTATKVGGEFLLSAMGIAMKVNGLPLYYIFGMGQGIQPVVGYNFGAKNKERVLKAQKHGMKMTFLGACVGSSIMFLFAKPIILIFTNEPNVVAFGTTAIRVMAIGLLFTSISNTIAVVYQAIGHGKAALLFSVLRQGVLLIPSIIILSKVYMEIGVIFSQFSADLLTLIISLIVYIPFIKKEKNLLN